MSSILDEIVSRTTLDLRSRRSRITESDLRGLPLWNDVHRSFGTALRSESLSIIAEIKSASPSKGVIRPDLDVPGVAHQYDEAGAAAISVLTEPHYFNGRLDYLRAARQACGIPILRKDFVIDPYQVVEARAHGADALLLIATCLGQSQLNELIEACDELGMEHLVEVYAASDLDKIDFDRIQILGVNSRDLHTFNVDLDRVAAIFNEVPAGITRVAESGISDAADLEKIIMSGADAILVGESLMRAEDPGDALRSLMETARTVSRTNDSVE